MSTPGAKKKTYIIWFMWTHFLRTVKETTDGPRAPRGVYCPQEIVDQIVDYISDDRATLLACTRLSRVWCIAARHHLYRTFKVSGSAGLKAINDLKTMGMIHLIKRMIATRKTNQADFLSPPKALARLNLFTHLQELHFRYLDVGRLVFRLHEDCDTLRSTVRTLALRTPTGSTTRIACFIGLFSKLENLTVENIDAVVTDDFQLPVIECPPPLTGQLTLSGISNLDFFCDLASIPKEVGFREVGLHCCQEVQDIIDACAGTMERLTWHSSGSNGG